MDVDVDSQGSKREQVLKAMQNFFGADRVLNIATFGTEKAKSALATAARGLGIPDDVSSYLSGLIVNERGFDKSLHETVYGDIDKGVKPNKPFVEEINKYPNYLETALAIEGLIKSRGSHASGQYYYTHDYTDINAMMKTPTGTKVTQWEYHDSDAMGSLKFDMLAIESLDKIRATMDLLLEDKRMEWQGDLKSTYDKYLHPKNLDYSKEMWKPTWENKVLDVFQLDTAVGKQAMRNAKPKDLKEVADLNSLMRLMAQPGQELPLDKYVRFKQNIQLWYEEMDNVGVPKVEVPILEKHYLPSYGVPNAQEQLMLLVMDKDVCGLSESEANMIRKVIGKKQMSKIPEVKDLVFSNSKLSMESTNYLWKTAIETQLGYSFSLLHTLAYSAIGLQELNLYNHFPSIYWNTGCLIVNSGDEEGSSTDYSKMAVALGATINHGIKVELTDINESKANFRPNPDKDYISYGLRSLSGIGYDFIQTILSLRPFTSLEDFYERAKPNKNQMLTLIKSGAFRKIDNENRKISLLKYAKLVTPKRKNLTIAQTGLLMQQGLLPESLNDEMALFEFNRYVKSELKTSGEITVLDERAQNFLIRIGQETMINTLDSWVVVRTDEWKAYYDKRMDKVRVFLKENKADLLDKIFDAETILLFEEYGGKESFAKWEMDSMNFYYTEHELAHMNFKKYGVVKFSDQPRIARKENPNLKFSKNILCSIVGTIIGKNKVKGSLDLLTPEGSVVMVKMYKGEFSFWDKQISESVGGGKKRVVEKSFFERGNKLYLTGFRRDDQFVPKIYLNTPTPKIGKIVEVEKDGSVKMIVERAE